MLGQHVSLFHQERALRRAVCDFGQRLTGEQPQRQSHRGEPVQPRPASTALVTSSDTMMSAASVTSSGSPRAGRWQEPHRELACPPGRAVRHCELNVVPHDRPWCVWLPAEGKRPCRTAHHCRVHVLSPVCSVGCSARRPRASRHSKSRDNISSVAGNNGANPATHFGRQMRKERLARGWSVHEFAKRSGMPQRGPCVAHREREASPDPSGGNGV